MAQVLEEFLVNVKYAIDSPSQQTFFDALKRVATSIAGVAGEITGLGVAILTLSEKMAAAGEKLYWASQRIGNSVTDIQNMAFAMSNLGMSADQAMSGIERFSSWTSNMGPAATGYLRTLGITATDTVGRMRQLGEYFRSHGGTADKMGTLEYTLALRRAQMMGIDENSMLAMSSGKVEAGIQQAGVVQRLVWGKDWQKGPQLFADQSLKVMNQFREMGLIFQNISQWFGAGLFTAILPDLKSINDLLIEIMPEIKGFLTHLISYAPTVLHFLEGAIKGFGAFVHILTFTMDTFDKLPEHAKAAIEVIAGLPMAMKMLGSPIFMVIAGLTALMLLLEDYEHWKDDQNHPGEKKTAYFNWGAVDEFLKPIKEGYKELSEWMDKVLPVKGVLDMLTGGAVAAGVIKITGALDGVLSKLMQIGAFLMFNPIGMVVMAAMGLLDVAVFGKKGQSIIGDRAKELGYKIEGEGTSAPTFTKDGRTLTYGEMIKEEGFGPSGVTWGQAHGTSKLPWEEGYKKEEPYLIPDLFPGAGKKTWKDIIPDNVVPAAPIITGQLQRTGGYQTASAGDDWSVPRGWGQGIDDTEKSNRFFDMIRLGFDTSLEKLSDILDTLLAMAKNMGVDPGSLPGGGGGGGGGGGESGGDFGPMLPPGAPLDQQEARLAKIMQRESGGRDVFNYMHARDPSHYTASGYYQMIDSTWLYAARLAGIDTRRYPHAIGTPFELQHRAALALMNAQGEKPWASSAPHHLAASPSLSSQPLGSDIGAGAYLRSRHTQHESNLGGLHHQVAINLYAPDPVTGAARVADAQARVFEQHVRYTKGSLLA